MITATIKRILKIALLCYLTGFTLHSIDRVLAQRDEMVEVAKANVTVRLLELKMQLQQDGVKISE